MTKRAIYVGNPRFAADENSTFLVLESLPILNFGMTGDVLSENKDGSVHFKTDEGDDWLLQSSEVHIS